tara:strand:+ start:88 stop:693 length:606 start_codon:yes stop_codon:yes gene_type:complete
MAAIFGDILAKGIRSGQVPARTDSARKWYRDQAQKIKKGPDILKKRILKEKGSSVENKIKLGNMYMFSYEAKHKDTLPYYDAFPLIFPINLAKGGFLGINMHYLPPQLRAVLMDEIYKTVTNEKYDETTRTKMSYDLLNGAAQYKEFKPCIKHYLSSQLRSRFIYITPAEWDIALFLPSAKFIGATKQKVYADSRKTIRGR